jgi:hypothetical protein
MSKKKKKMPSNKFILSILAMLVLLLTETPAVCAEMSNLRSVEAKENFWGIGISWIRPILQESEGVVVIRKEAECPVSTADGKEIYRGNGSYVDDLEAKIGQLYCYGAFVYDSSGNASVLRRTQIVEKNGPIRYVFLQVWENTNLTIGLIIIAILSCINRATMKKKREGNRVIMKV